MSFPRLTMCCTPPGAYYTTLYNDTFEIRNTKKDVRRIVIKNKFGQGYLFIFERITISWVLFNGHCHAKQVPPHYDLGLPFKIEWSFAIVIIVLRPQQIIDLI